MKCNVCGHGFEAMEEKHYVAREGERVGFIAFSKEAILYDAFDCPHCGCQIIAQERKRRIKEETMADEMSDCNQAEKYVFACLGGKVGAGTEAAEDAET